MLTASQAGLFEKCSASFVEDPSNDPANRAQGSTNPYMQRGTDIHSILHHGIMFGEEGLKQEAHRLGRSWEAEHLELWRFVKLIRQMWREFAGDVECETLSCEEREYCRDFSGQADFVAIGYAAGYSKMMVLDHKTGYYPDLNSVKSSQLDYLTFLYGQDLSRNTDVLKVIYHVDEKRFSCVLGKNGVLSDPTFGVETPGTHCIRCKRRASCQSLMTASNKLL